MIRFFSKVILATGLLAGGASVVAAQAEGRAEEQPAERPPDTPTQQKERTPAAPAGVEDRQADGAEPAKGEPERATLTVAVLDFATDTPGGPELGAQISEILTATLSGTDGIRLVDRSSLARALQEQELNLSGVVNAESAAKVGKVVGARLLVTGKAFVVGKKTFLTAKVIGTETSLVEPVLITGDKDADLGELAMVLAEKLGTRLREAGPRLVGDGAAAEPDPLPALRERLKTRRLPVVSVSVEERHVTANPGRGIDPAVETELRLLLKECGLKVIEGSDSAQAEAGVALLVGGEAVSEFAARIGNLVSCSARAEIVVKERKTGEVVFTHRETTRAVDLSEQIAGKTALQKAGRVIGLRLLEHLADTLPPAVTDTPKANAPAPKNERRQP